MRNIFFLVCVVTFIGVPLSLNGQLVSVEDPMGTVITEIIPVFDCGSPYENVPVARDSGKVWQFENTEWPPYTYFGIDKVTEHLIDGNDGTFPLCDNLVTATFSADSSDLENGIVRLNAMTNYPFLGATEARLTYVVTDSTGSPVPLTDSLGVILFDVTAVGNFNVRVLIEAYKDGASVPQVDDSCYPGTFVPTSQWFPAVELYDRVQSDPNNVICTAYNRDSSMVFYGPECLSVISISDSVSIEGSGNGETEIGFEVSITSDCANPTSFDWEIVHGTTDNDDFTGPLSGTVLMQGDTISKLVTVAVVKDDIVELDETFTIMLSNPSSLGIIGDGSGQGIIANDDTSTITISSPFSDEGDGNMPFAISLSKQIDTPIFVNFSTSDISASGGEDYVSQTNSVVAIGANTSFGFWAVSIIQDCRDEPSEQFSAILSNLAASGRPVFLADSTGTGTILDDDPVDIIEPMASCMDTTLQLGPDGTVGLVPDMIDNGSTDDCVIDTIYFSRDVFDCADLGVNEVSMYVVDGSGNIDSCTAQVTIIDTLDRCWPTNIAYVDSAGTGAQTGVDWENAFLTLDTALTVAAQYSNINQIWVAKGTYFPTSGLDRSEAFELLDNVAVHGGFANGDTSLVQQSLVINPTSLSGEIGMVGDSSDNCYHVVYVDTTIVSAVVSYVTIRDGNATTGALLGPEGAGVFNNGQLILNNVVVTNCYSDGVGAAIYNSGPSAQLSIDACTIEENTSMGVEDVVNLAGGSIIVIGGVSTVRN